MRVKNESRGQLRKAQTPLDVLILIQFWLLYWRTFLFSWCLHYRSNKFRRRVTKRRRKKYRIFEKRIFHFMLKVKFFFDFAFLKTNFKDKESFSIHSTKTTRRVTLKVSRTTGIEFCWRKMRSVMDYGNLFLSHFEAGGGKNARVGTSQNAHTRWNRDSNSIMRK